MSDFRIDSEALIDYTLRLQKINDVAMPMAAQNALNTTVKHAKQSSLSKVTKSMFDVKRPNFFKGNSAYQGFKAKKFNYNINKLRAEVMITKGKNPKEKATEQVANQQTAKSIKRGINPLGNKPQGKTIINLLKKKPEFVENREGLKDGNAKAVSSYIRGAARAKRRGAPLVLLSSSGLTGSVNRVKTFRKRRPTKRNPNKSVIKMQNIASYHKGGRVKLSKRHKFLDESLKKSGNEVLSDSFVKEAEKQFERVMKQ